jgi:hypothetical protein
MTTNGTTTISIDYLRFITETVERSLAAGIAPPAEWTKTLRREHYSIVHKIREYTDHSTPCFNSRRIRGQFDSSHHLHQAYNGYIHENPHEEVRRYGDRLAYQNTKKQSILRNSCSTVESERAFNDTVGFGNIIKNGGASFSGSDIQHSRTVKHIAGLNLCGSCRHRATEFDDIVGQVINILHQPPGQFPLLEDHTAQSLLDSLQTARHPTLFLTLTFINAAIDSRPSHTGRAIQRHHTIRIAQSS